MRRICLLFVAVVVVGCGNTDAPPQGESAGSGGSRAGTGGNSSPSGGGGTAGTVGSGGATGGKAGQGGAGGTSTGGNGPAGSGGKGGSGGGGAGATGGQGTGGSGADGGVDAGAGGKGAGGTGTGGAGTGGASGGSYVFVGAGNMGDGVAVKGATGTIATGLLLKTVMDANPNAVVFAAGDNAYNSGTQADFAASWGVSHWGDYKSKVRAIMGDHDYKGGGYPWTYFSNSGTQAVPYYSFDLGAWHIVMLDTNISGNAAQTTWLKADLAANAGKKCTMALMHHAAYENGGGNASGRVFWPILYAAGVDVVYQAHTHHYERLKPLDANGGVDTTGNGMRAFVAGMGGTTLAAVATPKAIVDAQPTKAGWGIVKFGLSDGSYTWEFIPVAGDAWTDSGSGTCHDAP